MSVIIQSLFPIPSRDTYIDPLPIIMFHGANALLLYNIFLSCVVRPRGITLYFYSYKMPHLVPHYFSLIRLVTYCYGYSRYYAYYTRVTNFYCVPIKDFF